MSSTIRIKRSSVRGKIPNTSNISTGELALNLADKRLYTSNGTATFEIGTNPNSLSVGSGSFTIANGAITFPTSAGSADQVLAIDGSGNLSFTDQSSIRSLSVLSPQKLDSISTVDGQAAYTLQISGTNHSPLEINAVVVSLNGIIQEPGTDFTISGSTITFSPALQSGDVVDFIIDLGRAIGVTASSFTLEPVKLDSITTDGSSSYSLAYSNTAYTPNQTNGLLVSLNGIIQEPGTSFTISGSTITFDQAILATDVIDFIVDYTGGGTMYVSGEAVYSNITANNIITANNFVGDGSQLTGLNYNNISNAPNVDQYLQVANAVSTYATISTVNSNLANTNAYIASTQGNIDTLESTVNANLANTNVYIATKLDTSAASATYVTKTDAVTSNNSILSLIDDRLQVANAVSTYATISNVNANLANTNAYIASNYSTLWAALTSTNTAIRSSISSEIASLVDSAPATLDTLNELAAALGDDANFSTTVTNLIGTKLSVANAVSTYATISNVNANLANTNAYIASTQGNINTLESTVNSNLANTNAYIASTQGNIDTLETTVNSNLANTNAYIASTQGNIDTLESTVNANLANTNAYIATKLDSSTASATYVTKTDAVASNNVVVSLINDRLQVANAVATYATISTVNANLANTNAYIATTQGNIDTLETTVNSNLANTNAYIATTQGNIDTLESTVNANLANTNAYIATKLDSSTASSTYNTKVDAVASNNALLSLINDRMQVANVSSLISSEVAALVDSAPTTLDTLNELAAALGDDANFSTTITASLGTKAANSYVNSQLALKTDSTTFNAFVSNTNLYIATKADATSLDAYLQVANANFVTQSTLDNYLQVANGVAVTTYNSNRLDAISVANGVLSYALTKDAVRYVPGSSHALLVSLNGVIQKPITDYSVIGSTITFASAMVTGQDVVDFIIDTGAGAGVDLPTVSVLDTIATVNGQATYTLLSSNTQHTPSDVSNLRVSVNGVIQEPTADFTVSGNTITFIPALVTNDVVDYVIDHGLAYSVTPIAAPTTLDSTTVVNGQATYDLKLHEKSYAPASANHLLVSKNGVVQKPGTDFTVSGTTITFIPSLVTNDVVNFITDLGATVSPSDIVTKDQLDVEISNVSGASVDLSGYLQVANSTNFATTSQLDSYLQVANSTLDTITTNGSTTTNSITVGQLTIGSGNYLTNEYVLQGTTTSNTETEILIGGSSRVPVASNTTIFYEVSIAARRTDATGESGSWHLKGCVDNFSGTVADVGAVYEIAVAQDDVTLAVDARADDTNNSLNVYVSGANSKTYRWIGVVKTIEVSQ